jgi:hypothetical protein
MLPGENAIRVDKSIAPTPSTIRNEPALTVGANYYVCFGNNIAYPCTLIEIIGGSPKRIRISKKDRGEIFGEHVLFSDEIGLTPEEAVRNTARF